MSLNARFSTTLSRIGLFCGGVLLVLTSCSASRRSDDGLVSYVDTLSAIDSHAHPMAYVLIGAPADSDFDALPLDGIPAFDLPLPLRADNPAYHRAQESLYGLSAGANDSTRAAVRNRAIQQHGEHYPDWVLDQLHIDVMLANRVAMAAYLRPLDFDPADSSTAANIYVRYAKRGVPTHPEYKTLEDYLIRYITRESGRLGMAVQIHSTNGFGKYYSAAGAAPICSTRC